MSYLEHALWQASPGNDYGNYIKVVKSFKLTCKPTQAKELATPKLALAFICEPVIQFEVFKLITQRLIYYGAFSEHLVNSQTHLLFIYEPVSIQFSVFNSELHWMLFFNFLIGKWRHYAQN